MRIDVTNAPRILKYTYLIISRDVGYLFATFLLLIKFKNNFVFVFFFFFATLGVHVEDLCWVSKIFSGENFLILRL